MGLALLVAALAVATVLWVIRPLPGGSGYNLAVETCTVLLVVWAAMAARPALLRRPAALVAVAVAGFAAAAVRGIGIDPHAEVVRTYGSLFTAIADGRNPYTCDCIVHLTPAGPRLGDFNYPPAEIWPYQAVHELFGGWGMGFLAVTVVALNLVAAAALLLALPRAWRIPALAFLPLLVLWEVGATIGMTMLVTAGIVATVLDGMRAERRWHRPALWVLFGVGFLTKFAILPLFAAWWLAGASRGGLAPGRRLRTAADAVVPAAIAVALCLPFGPASVVRSTVLFNADLGGRAELTTFYPNVISGLASWTGAERLYPVVALAGLAVALAVGRRMRPVAAMLLAVTAFLLVSPTPEPQYVPMVVLLFLGALVEREGAAGRTRGAGAGGAGPTPAPA
ncbi:MAG TPA: hypothetical protein PKD59_05050 [Miltoncostaeaceae bacterium]|nr:hypothetical protein [Miltoncostaeaceae bacterium]